MDMSTDDAAGFKFHGYTSLIEGISVADINGTRSASRGDTTTTSRGALQHPMFEEVHEDRHEGENSKDDRESSFLSRVQARILLGLSSPRTYLRKERSTERTGNT
jgi:hypothetical protein